jgi:lipoprotein-releasing system permease protein
LPVRLEGLDVVLIALAALAICFLATLYPARQASRLDPVEALRHG